MRTMFSFIFISFFSTISSASLADNRAYELEVQHQLRAEHRFVGVQFFTRDKVMGLVQTKSGLYQIVEIDFRNRFKVNEMRPLTAEYTQDGLKSLNEKIKQKLSEHEVRAGRLQPGMNLFTTALNTFVVSGFDTAAIGVIVFVGAGAIDILTSPLQLGWWSQQKWELFLNKTILSKQMDVLSPEILKLEQNLYVTTRSAILATQSNL